MIKQPHEKDNLFSHLHQYLNNHLHRFLSILVIYLHNFICFLIEITNTTIVLFSYQHVSFRIICFHFKDFRPGAEIISKVSQIVY
ncbi:hypothetical protein IC582_017082 [Cucumis melo]